MNTTRRELRQRESNPFPRVQRMPEAWRKPEVKAAISAKQFILIAAAWLAVMIGAIWLASEQGMNVLSMIWSVK